MATYRQIQEWVKARHRFEPKTCWIAHVKELCGLQPRKASNRKDPEVRANPCPPERVEPIKSALKYFRMLTGCR